MEVVKTRLLDRYRNALMLRHYALKTEKSYIGWTRRFVRFHGFKTESEMLIEPESLVSAWLSSMAERVSPSTQNQALSAILFLYSHVLLHPLAKIDAMRAKRGRELRETPNIADVHAMLDALEGTIKLACELQFGCALRVSEAVRLRIKDIDFIHGEILIHEPKHGVSRAVMLPMSLRGKLQSQIEVAKKAWQADSRNKELSGVFLPGSLAIKYPSYPWMLKWFWLFPSANTSLDPRTRVQRRHHISTELVQMTVRRISRRLGIDLTCHAFRHASAQAFERSGASLGSIQRLLGHRHIDTTLGYLHRAPDGRVQDMKSPLDEGNGNISCPDNKRNGVRTFRTTPCSRPL